MTGKFMRLKGLLTAILIFATMMTGCASAPANEIPNTPNEVQEISAVSEQDIEQESTSDETEAAISETVLENNDPQTAEAIDVTLDDLTPYQIELFKATSISFVESVRDGAMTIDDLVPEHDLIIDVYVMMNELPQNGRQLFNEWKESVGYYEKLSEWLSGVDAKVIRPNASDVEQSAETANHSDKPYSFSTYDDDSMNSEKRHLKAEDLEGDFTVYIVPQGTRTYVEAYQDDIMVNMIRLDEYQNGYWQTGMGELTDNNTWVAEQAFIKTGRRYDITMNEPGMWLYNIWEWDTRNVTHFFFEVDASDPSVTYVSPYLMEVLNKNNLTIEEVEKFEQIMDSTYQLRKNYTRQKLVELFEAYSTKLFGRALTDNELESMSSMAAGYWNRWTPSDDDEFDASGERPIIEAEYHSLVEQGTPLEEMAKILIEKYPYAPGSFIGTLLKNGGAFLPFFLSDFYKF